MSVFPKFIIETDEILGNCLIAAFCTYHKQLVTNDSKVKGGGWWTKKDDGSFIFHGDSHDYGKSTMEDIQDCVKNKKVFSNRSLTRNISDKYEFFYRDHCGETFKLS